MEGRASSADRLRDGERTRVEGVVVGQPTVAVPPAGTVTVSPLPTITTLTAEFDPFTVSVTVHGVLAGMFE